MGFKGGGDLKKIKSLYKVAHFSIAGFLVSPLSNGYTFLFRIHLVIPITIFCFHRVTDIPALSVSSHQTPIMVKVTQHAA